MNYQKESSIPSSLILKRISRSRFLSSPGLRIFFALIVLTLILSACLPAPQLVYQDMTPTPAPDAEIIVTPLPTREIYEPGQLVDYTIQDGDSMVALAARFNTTIEEIRKANPVIPETTTTLPPGMPVKIPIYYLPLWGSTYQIIPNALFVNGPAQRDFNTVEFVNDHPGWLKAYSVYAYGGWRTGGELVDYIATSYSVSPRLLLALLEYRAEALSNPVPPENVDRSLLGQRREMFENLYYQLLWLADTLNNGYYQFLDGKLLSHELMGGELERYDPWQNAATVSLQNYFASILPNDAYYRAIAPDGFTLVYQKLFGDIWFPIREPVMGGSLMQPELSLPFVPGKSWSYTGGPHPVWGEENPWAAIDFAPPSDLSGCAASVEWVTAVGDGVITRTEPGLAILDLDGDGDERTGWNILYLHLSSSEAAPQGKRVVKGDVIGHPSCERGRATGTHVHVARKYNGQWIPADGIIPFNLEGWVTHSTGIAYQGTLTRHSQVVTACTCSDQFSVITSQR